MTRGLASQVATMTGAASGVGAAHARVFAAHGARLVIADIDERGSQAVAESIGGAGDDAIFLRLDVASEESWTNLVSATMAEDGKLTTLIDKAGIKQMDGVEQERLAGDSGSSASIKPV